MPTNKGKQQIKDISEYIKKTLTDDGTGVVFIPSIKDAKSLNSDEDYSIGVFTNIQEYEMFVLALYNAIENITKDTKWLEKNGMDNKEDYPEPVLTMIATMFSTALKDSGDIARNLLTFTTKMLNSEGNSFFGITFSSDASDAIKQRQKDISLENSGTASNITDPDVLARTIGAGILCICKDRGWDVEQIAGQIYNGIMCTTVVTDRDDKEEQ